MPGRILGGVSGGKYGPSEVSSWLRGACMDKWIEIAELYK